MGTVGVVVVYMYNKSASSLEELKRGKASSTNNTQDNTSTRLLSVNILIPDVGFVCHEFSDEGAVTSLEPCTHKQHTLVHNAP